MCINSGDVLVSPSESKKQTQCGIRSTVLGGDGHNRENATGSIYQVTEMLSVPPHMLL